MAAMTCTSVKGAKIMMSVLFIVRLDGRYFRISKRNLRGTPNSTHYTETFLFSSDVDRDDECRRGESYINHTEELALMETNQNIKSR